jgi:hypothetical protein
MKRKMKVTMRKRTTTTTTTRMRRRRTTMMRRMTKRATSKTTTKAAAAAATATAHASCLCDANLKVPKASESNQVEAEKKRKKKTSRILIYSAFAPFAHLFVYAKRPVFFFLCFCCCWFPFLKRSYVSDRIPLSLFFQLFSSLMQPSLLSLPPSLPPSLLCFLLLLPAAAAADCPRFVVVSCV